MYKKIRKELLNSQEIYLKKHSKEYLFLSGVKSLMKHHMRKCKPFKLILSSITNSRYDYSKISSFPFIPVDLFKSMDLLSIKRENISNKLISSGTSGLNSRIFLDKENALVQSTILKKILDYEFGKQRRPIIFFENEKFDRSSNQMDAKRAAILGFSLMSNKRYFLQSDDLKGIRNKLIQIMSKHKKEKIIIFGFTFDIWKRFVLNKGLNNLKFSNCILIHGGGWKKLENLKVSEKKFKQKLKSKFSFNKIVNYYGLVEQIGSIFFECKKGYFHTTNFSDILIRDTFLRVLPLKKKGTIQLISLIPTSYPGNSILTQDIGEIIGEDDCDCGKKGKYFKVYGRMKKSEMRGCSNV
tara:strand:- start:760 stop:1821 length:1062 start_codon:yes stop_codon:yes gene_type:complete